MSFIIDLALYINCFSCINIDIDVICKYYKLLSVEKCPISFTKILKVLINNDTFSISMEITC